MDNKSHLKVEMGSERSFGLVFVLISLAVALWPAFYGDEIRYIALGFAIVVLGIALKFPSWLSSLNRVWFRFGLLLGLFFSPIMLGAIFITTVVPTGLIMRALGKDLLRQKINKTAKSYWIRRDEPLGSMKNMF